MFHRKLNLEAVLNPQNKSGDDDGQKDTYSYQNIVQVSFQARIHPVGVVNMAYTNVSDQYSGEEPHEAQLNVASRRGTFLILMKEQAQACWQTSGLVQLTQVTSASNLLDLLLIQRAMLSATFLQDTDPTYLVIKRSFLDHSILAVSVHTFHEPHHYFEHSETQAARMPWQTANMVRVYREPQWNEVEDMAARASFLKSLVG